MTEENTEARTDKPDVHEIEVGGQKFLVTGAMKEAFEKERKEKERTPVEKFSPPETPPIDPPGDPGGNFFDDPDAAIDSKIQRAKKEWREEYNREREIEKWWDNFFGKYKALRGKKVLIQAIMQQHLPDLEKIQAEKSADAAMEELAKIVRKELILDVKDNDADAPSPVVEGGPAVMTGHPAQTEGSPTPEKPITLGTILKKRLDRRREPAKAAG